MATIKAVWGYRAGIFIALSVWAGYAIASGSADVIIPIVETVVGHR